MKDLFAINQLTRDEIEELLKTASKQNLDIITDELKNKRLLLVTGIVWEFSTTLISAFNCGKLVLSSFLRLITGCETTEIGISNIKI